MVFRRIGRELGLGGKKDDDERDEDERDDAAPQANDAPATASTSSTVSPPVDDFPAVPSDPSLIDPSWSVADPVVETVVREAATDPPVEAAPVAEEPVAEEPAAEAEAPAQQTYTVEAGDTLSAIAQRFHGDASAYPRIFDANRDQLDNPDKIQPGQVLVIPS